MRDWQSNRTERGVGLSLELGFWALSFCARAWADGQCLKETQEAGGVKRKSPGHSVDEVSGLAFSVFQDAAQPRSRQDIGDPLREEHQVPGHSQRIRCMGFVLWPVWTRRKWTEKRKPLSRTWAPPGSESQPSTRLLMVTVAVGQYRDAHGMKDWTFWNEEQTVCEKTSCPSPMASSPRRSSCVLSISLGISQGSGSTWASKTIQLMVTHVLLVWTDSDGHFHHSVIHSPPLSMPQATRQTGANPEGVNTPWIMNYTLTWNRLTGEKENPQSLIMYTWLNDQGRQVLYFADKEKINLWGIHRRKKTTLGVSVSKEF